MREELKYIPDDAEEIIKKCSISFMSQSLATAMKAICIADEIIANQSDTILQCTNEFITCLKTTNSKNSCSPEFERLTY